MRSTDNLPPSATPTLDPTTPRPSPETLGWALAITAVVVFSFSLPLTKIAVRTLDAMFVASGRAALAGIIAAALLFASRQPPPTPPQIKHLLGVIAGVVIGFPLLTSFALRHTPSSHGAIVLGLLPLATAGAAVIRAGERPSRLYWCSGIVGMAAVVAYALDNGGGSLHLADLLLALTVISAAIGIAEGGLLARTMAGWKVMSWALVFALPITIPVSLLGLPDLFHASTDSVAAFALSALFPMYLAYLAWYSGIARLGIARAGQLQLLQPSLTLLWAWPLLGEQLTRTGILTTLVVLAAVAAGRRGGVRQAPIAQPVEDDR